MVAAHRKLVIKLSLVTVAMFGFGFALVPLYDLICDVTGIGGKTGRIEAATATIDRSRTVTVEFAALATSGLPWEFKPMQRRVTAHPGEAVTVKYLVSNRAREAVTGQAVPSVAPIQAAKYFDKIECFCFTQQTLAAQEVKEMPVTFVVDPKIGKDIETITLSYSFFNTDRASARRYGGEAKVADQAHQHHHAPAVGG